MKKISVCLQFDPESLLLRMIPGDILSACPHRQFHTLPGLLDSQAALSNSYPNACVPMQGGSLYHFYGLWYDPAGTQIHDLPCERQTRLPLSQPDTVIYDICCGIVYHYPIYGGHPLGGQSNLSYACTHRSLTLFSTSRWHSFLYQNNKYKHHYTTQIDKIHLEHSYHQKKCLHFSTFEFFFKYFSDHTCFRLVFVTRLCILNSFQEKVIKQQVAEAGVLVKSFFDVPQECTVVEMQGSYSKLHSTLF